MSTGTVADRLGVPPERAWGGAVLALLVGLVGGSIAFPRTVYDGFVWQYFWGPVEADANSAVCAVRTGGTTEYLSSAAACDSAAGIVAYPGYTLVSEIGYVIVLIVALTGVVFLLRRLDLGRDKRFFYALVPFMFLGGALRVVEDATDAGGITIEYPWNTLLISPVIYFTMFGLVLVAVVGTTGAARRGLVDGWTRPLAAIGTALTGLVLAGLSVLAVTKPEIVEFHPQVLSIVLVGSILATWGTWKLTQAYAPSVHEGTEKAGLVVLFAHAVDGTANVVGLDWMTALGAGANLVPKHPANQFVVDTTAALLPAAILGVTGDAWPFLLVKLLAASLVLWIFEGEMFEESPRYTILLLIAVVAVGLGPGTRDMLRATFGI